MLVAAGGEGFIIIQKEAHHFLGNYLKTYLKIHMANPKSWRFGSDDFPFHFGGF